jgi:hypothetical protein
MKRLGVISGLSLLSVILISCLSTSRIERAAYLRQDYFKNTVARLDSITPAAAVIVSDSLQAGFARVSITPSLHNSRDVFSEGKFIQLPLAGYGARKGKSSTGIHDSIFVKAAALKINKQTIVFVGADLLIMPPNIIDSVMIVLAGKGILREQLFFSATHSHSSLGGWASGYVGKEFAGKENKNLQRWLIQQISRAVELAIADLKPARIGYGSFDAGNYTRNRVIGEAGTKNNDFSFIELEQPGFKRAIIGSFSAHSTTMGSENLEISADYPGYWERKMEATSADVALFFAGSVGSQSPVGLGDGFEKARFIGEALADSLNRHLPLVSLQDRISFSAISLKLQLPPYHIRVSHGISLSTFVSRKLMPFPENVYLQAMRIGNLVWITTPCDFSGEYALQLKNALAAKGFITSVSSFNGSYVGYIVPGRYFYYDQYESQLMGWFGPNMGEYTMDLIRKISAIVSETKNI